MHRDTEHKTIETGAKEPGVVACALAALSKLLLINP